MSKFRVEFHDDQAHIDLSPMLDVVFIMLIFFIVVASFVKETGLALNLPSTANSSDSPVESIHITARADGAFDINGRVVMPDGVRPYVQALHAENSDAPLLVLLERGSVVRSAAIAADAVRSVGLEVVPVVALD